jgi:hypothetical protein
MKKEHVGTPNGAPSCLRGRDLGGKDAAFPDALM